MSATTDVVVKHRYRPQDHSTIDGNAYCWCGWSRTLINTHKTAVTLHAEHVESELANASSANTVEDLDALPEYAVIRAEEHREMPSGRKHVIGRYFEKASQHRNGWLELNPSDRMDGEDTMPAALVVNYYGTGGCTVLYRPEDAARAAGA